MHDKTSTLQDFDKIESERNIFPAKTEKGKSCLVNNYRALIKIE